MSDDELDPGAPTQMFQAFMDRPEPEPARSGWLWSALALAAVLVVALVAWLTLGS
jgi:hypothetical protein